MVYSQPAAQKVRNIRRNPRVSLHLRDIDEGEDVVSIEATASIVAAEPRADRVPDYVATYERLIANLRMDPERFAGEYSLALRIVPTLFRLF